MSEPEDSEPTVAQASGAHSYVVTLDLRPGAVFHSRYEVQAPLGRGGMGMVFRAHDRVLDETVAIKVLRPDVAEDPRMAERFRSEIKLARKVRHRNVCAIHDYGEDQGLLFISMEMVEGMDLKHRLRDSGALPPAQAYDVSIQIAEGLQAVHDAGIVHRDLKTPNIMIDAGGVARLMDFGVAKRIGDGTMTTTGHVVGTPEYMSPEQAQGHGVDARSDVYALGVVIFEVFTGQVPFRGDTPISTILKHINDPPPLDHTALPEALRPVLRRALAKDPAARHASARELGEALRAARSAPSLPATPVEMPTVTRYQRPPLPAAPPAGPRAAPRSRLQPWLLVLPVAAVAGGVVVVQMRPRAAATVAMAPPTTLVASAATAPPVVTTVPAAVASAVPSSAPATLIAAATPRPPRPTPSPMVRATPGVPVMAAPIPPPATTLAAAPAPPAAPGLLQVVVRPWGEVTIDGRVAGQTPLDRIPLAPGAHRVRVRHPSYDVWESEVTVRSGQVEKVTVDFPALAGRRQ